jgi:hypothetical protein
MIRVTLVGAEQTSAGPRLTVALSHESLAELLRSGRFGSTMTLADAELLDRAREVVEAFARYRESQEPWSAAAAIEGVGPAYAGLFQAVQQLRACYAAPRPERADEDERR